MAALAAFRMGPTPKELDELQSLYYSRWALYEGTLFSASVNPYQNNPAIYQNTKLILKTSEAVVDFYAGVVFQGALADEPEQGAIPWKLLVDGEPVAKEVIGPDGAITTPEPPPSPARNLWLAILELQSAWNWQQQMSLRPMYAAALGDCLTELVDDLDRRFVYPQVIWPGYVKAIELDYVGNVRRYVLEYRVEERDDKDQLIETYTYRKEVDGETFRYFKNDKPHDYGDGTVVPNPYDFCPAVWDRHRIGAPGMVRGKSAIDGTWQAVMQLNSIFSHAFDFQRKAFFQPIVLSAGSGGGANRNINLSAPNGTAQELAETQDYITVGAGAQMLQAQMDIGKTLEMLQEIKQGILAENPEASFYQQMREMQQVTAPGAERLMGDVKNRVDLVRAGMDAGTVKLFQMAISMCAFRANGSVWRKLQRNQQLTPRQAIFLPFDLGSYDNGLLDMTILQRPLVPMTEQERIEVLSLKETLQSRWAMAEAGIKDTDAMAILAERQSRYAFAVDAGAFGQDYDPDAEPVVGEAA